MGVTNDTDRSGFLVLEEAGNQPLDNTTMATPPGMPPPPDNNNNNNNRNDNKGPGESLLSASERFETRGQVFGDMILVGRGGGVALVVNADSTGSVEVSGCEFVENAAVEFGGGLYVLLQGSHTLTLTRNRCV